MHNSNFCNNVERKLRINVPPLILLVLVKMSVRGDVTKKTGFFFFLGGGGFGGPIGIFSLFLFV